MDPATIEQIVGARRHARRHIARAVSEEENVYLLHSAECKDSGIDLTACLYSIVLSRGINRDRWDGWEDKPVLVSIDVEHGLIPVRDVAPL